MFGVDIMDELKSLSANINSIESKIICHSPDSVDSLVNELNEINNIQPVDQSGWRLLGTRNVWKADWTDYDKRQLNRLKQRKQAENARKRKKQARFTNNNHTHHNRNHTSRRSDMQHNHSYHQINNNCNNDGALNIMRSYSGNSLLPPDRILLAAAKERFSKPPRWSSSDAPTTHRPIQFQSGEILNPYPTNDEFPRSTSGRQTNLRSPGYFLNSATLCEACHAQRSCF